MHTVFIPLFQGVEAKNILRTEVYTELLKRPDIRLVFFVPNQMKADYYQKEFNDSRVIYEVVENWKINSIWEKLFSALKFKLINTETMDLRRRMAAQDNPSHRFLYPFTWFINRLIAYWPVRQMARFLDYRLVSPTGFDALFDRYKPDVVFLAHLFDDMEVAMLREAKRRGARNIGFINSWDKLTARCMMRLQPDKLLVYNDIVKGEAINLGDMRPENVVTVGVPHYDQYVNKKPNPRERFYQKIGVDPVKRILLYSPIGKYFSNSDWDIIDLLRSFQEKKLIPSDTELLVRFQPNDFYDEVELKKRSWLKFDRPGVRFSNKRGVDWDMSSADLEHLNDTLHYASLLVCYAASIAVDMAAFDKPVININFEVKEKQRMSQTPTYFYQMSHYRKALATGGIKLVKSPEELARVINDYLDNPALDREGRQRLVEQQCWRLDGQAGRRIAHSILNSSI